MKRALQVYLVNELSKEVLAGTFAAGDTVYVDVKKDVLTFGKKSVKGAASVAEWRTRLKPKPAEKTTASKKRQPSKKEKLLDEVKKATKDLNEAVDEVKKG
jgi:ATP-dependent Clp protease ATP-binding subunit ClpB